jgi:hypothetical protein
MKIDISQEDFGMLCICAIRYCHGRKTYMPSLIQGIVRQHLSEFSDKDISIMIDDCDFQRRANLYGDSLIDKPDWLKWQQDVSAEYVKRKGC